MGHWGDLQKLRRAPPSLTAGMHFAAGMWVPLVVALPQACPSPLLPAYPPTRPPRVQLDRLVADIADDGNADATARLEAQLQACGISYTLPSGEEVAASATQELATR